MAKRQTLLPGLQIPDNIDPALKSFLDSVKQHIEVRSGFTGDVVDRFVTIRELQKAGYTTSGKTGTLQSADKLVNDNAPTIDSPPDLDRPPRPENFEAAAAIGVVILKWKDPRSQYSNHAYTEIYRASVDDIGQAELIGNSPHFLYVDDIGTGVTYYYWVRFVSNKNKDGDYNAIKGSVVTASQVAENDLEDLSIGTAKIKLAAITSALIADLAVVTAKIGLLSVGTAQIADLAITDAKVDSLSANKILAGTITAALIMTGKLTLGGSAFGASGIQLDYNTGNPRFYAGNGAEKYIKFESSTGEITLGVDTEFLGSDSYNNEAVYYSFSGGYANWAISTNGTATTEKSGGAGFLRLYTGINNFDRATAQLGQQQNLTKITWNKNRRLRAILEFDTDATLANHEVRFGFGRVSYTGTWRSIYFLVQSGNLYGVCCDGTTCTTSLLTTGFTVPVTNEFEIIFTSGVNAKFYQNGSLLGTVTTNLPSGTTYAYYIVLAESFNNGAVTGDSNFHVHTLKFLQEK